MASANDDRAGQLVFANVRIYRTPIYDNDGIVVNGGGLGQSVFGPIECVSM